MSTQHFGQLIAELESVAGKTEDLITKSYDLEEAVACKVIDKFKPVLCYIVEDIETELFYGKGVHIKEDTWLLLNGEFLYLKWHGDFPSWEIRPILMEKLARKMTYREALKLTNISLKDLVTALCRACRNRIAENKSKLKVRRERLDFIKKVEQLMNEQ